MKIPNLIQVAVASVVITLASPLSADTMSVPDEKKPVFTLEVPADWNPRQTVEDAVEATSPDDHVYLLSWLVTGSDIKKLSSDLAETLKDAITSVDAGATEDTFESNGIKFTVMKGTGTGQRGEHKVKFQAALFQAGPGKVGIVYADYAAAAPAKTPDVLKGIVKSVKAKR
ncbi:MAG TPA: hypothetical protein VJ719_02095 [Chthoniobacterales bacterium]|nr:hypothetical protein [Chthoniobacterales bacterium]